MCGVSKMFGEWYQKTNKTECTNKLTLLAFKISPSFTTHGWQHAAAIQQRVTAVLRSIPKEAFADSLQKLYERCDTSRLTVNILWLQQKQTQIHISE
jgi:hypothetical protein